MSQTSTDLTATLNSGLHQDIATSEPLIQMSYGPHKLPDELITVILVHLSRDQLRQWHEHNRPSSSALARRMQSEYSFCRRIRAVANCTRELWTFIPLCREPQLGPWVDTCVSRARDRALVLYVRLPFYCQPTIDRVVSFSSRARELCIVFRAIHPSLGIGLPQQAMREIFWQRPWPTLDSLVLRGEEEGGVFLPSDLPNAFFRTLVTLHIESHTLVHEQPIVQQKSPLEHLSINILHAHSSDALRESLSYTPALVSLHITFHDQPRLAIAAGTHPVDLPHLRSASLCGNPHQLLMLLSYLPDPLERLSLDLTSVQQWCHQHAPHAKVAEEPLAARVLKYCERYSQRTIESQTCKLVLCHQDQSVGFAFTPTTPPMNTSIRSWIDVRSNLSCPNVLNLFAEVSTTLEVLPGFELGSNSAMSHIVEALTSIVAVKVHVGDHHWVRMEEMEHILRKLKDKNLPLKTLVVYAPASLNIDELKLRWLEEGLIQEMIKEVQIPDT